MDRNEKIWAFSNTGTKMHAFVSAWKDKDGNESTNRLRAMCRGTIARSADATFTTANHAIGVCPRCEKLAGAMYDRAEASMQPATESHDLGYVVPAGKFTDAQRDAMQEEFDAAVAASQEGTVIEGDHAEAPTMDETRETIAPDFPAGTRVTLSNGWHGTVLEKDRGVIPNITSGKSPQAFVRVKVDPQRGAHPATLLKVTADLTNLDALHAEALEMDGLETVLAAREPRRYHYRAVLATSGGTPLDGIEGYINAIDRDAAEDALKERFQTDLVRLTSLRINTA